MKPRDVEKFRTRHALSAIYTLWDAEKAAFLERRKLSPPWSFLPAAAAANSSSSSSLN